MIHFSVSVGHLPSGANIGMKFTSRAMAHLVFVAVLGALFSGCNSVVAAQSDQPEININVVMKKWMITPDVIRVKKGTLVHLHITTPDVQHGFDVKGLNISEAVDPGKTTDINFVADKPGKYEIECGILCGKGHDDMTGSIIVEN